MTLDECPSSSASPLPVHHLTVDVYVGDPRHETPVLGGRYRYADAVHGNIEILDVMTPDLTRTLTDVLSGLPGADREPAAISIGWTFEDNVGVTWRKVPGQRLGALGESGA